MVAKAKSQISTGTDFLISCQDQTNASMCSGDAGAKRYFSGTN